MTDANATLFLVDVDFLGKFGPDSPDFDAVLISDDGRGQGRGAVNVNNRAIKNRVRAAATPVDESCSLFEVVAVAKEKRDLEQFLVSILFNGGHKGLTFESARKNYRDQWDGMDFDYILSTIEHVNTTAAEKALKAQQVQLTDR